jgi:hypothetical protein
MGIERLSETDVFAPGADGATSLPPTYVEIETSRYCNRACLWCPNGNIGGRETQELMPWPLFTRIVEELCAIGFEGRLALHNYNEPLANPRLFDELAFACMLMPPVELAIYTNGDLLDLHVLKRLLAAGVRHVRVTRYPTQSHDRPEMRTLFSWLKATGLDAFDWTISPVRQGIAAKTGNDGARQTFEVILPSISTYTYRGGTSRLPVPPPLRRAPCRMTATSGSIDYRGNLKMCCNVVAECHEHRGYVAGNLQDVAFSALWNSQRMSSWRLCHSLSDWSDTPVCRNCTQVMPEGRGEHTGDSHDDGHHVGSCKDLPRRRKP